jgi:hypothetical protein
MKGAIQELQQPVTLLALTEISTDLELTISIPTFGQSAPTIEYFE